MPHLRIETNVPRDKIPSNWGTELMHLMAEMLGKPLDWCCVTIVPDQWMTFGKPGDPCAQCFIQSVGKLDPVVNIKHTHTLFTKVTKDLNIMPSRFIIRFIDMHPDYVGHDETGSPTFHYPD